jgi:hypothetical protein
VQPEAIVTGAKPPVRVPETVISVYVAVLVAPIQAVVSAPPNVALPVMKI